MRARCPHLPPHLSPQLPPTASSLTMAPMASPLTMAAVRWAPAALLLAMLALAGCSSAPTLAPSPTLRPAAPASASGAPVRVPEAGVPALPAAGSGRGGYYQDDGPGDNPPPNLGAVPDAEVRNDPLMPRANRPYVVFGKTYTPLTDNQPYSELGIGSWYGKKFHGQRTSSGELYDMYKMTAAHPTLPIPSYARLTNLISGAQVIVRINDRGPFHSNRAIDVSYTAALKLGLLGKGSHELKIDRILPDEVNSIIAARAAAPVRTQLITPQSTSALPPLVLAPRAVPRTSLSLGAQSQSQSQLSAPASASALAASTAAATPVVTPTAPAAVATSTVSTAVAPTTALALSAPTIVATPRLPSTPTSVPTQRLPSMPSMPSSSLPLAAAAPLPAGDIEALMLADRAPATVATDVSASAGATPPAPAARSGYYLQLGAYTRAENAEVVRAKVAQTTTAFSTLEVVAGGAVMRLFGGPFASRQEAAQAAQGLPSSLGLKPIIIQR